MFQSAFSTDIFSELENLHQQMQRAFNAGTGIRGNTAGAYPLLNIGRTPQSIELYAFAPGLDPANIEVNLERGVLTVAAERKGNLPPQDGKSTIHINERFAGRFRRVLSLPENIDPGDVAAQYRDGVLHIQLKLRESAQPRRITVQ